MHFLTLIGKIMVNYVQRVDKMSMKETLSHRWMRSLRWRQNEHDGVSNHQRLDCLLIRLFRRRSASLAFVLTGGLSSQRASNAGKASVWWRNHVMIRCLHLHKPCYSVVIQPGFRFNSQYGVLLPMARFSWYLIAACGNYTVDPSSWTCHLPIWNPTKAI